MSAALAARIVCVAMLLVTLAGEVRGVRSLRVVGKLTASIAFVVHALLLGVPSIGPAGLAIVAGLALSVGGDALLLSERKRDFMIGIGVFLLAHVAFVVAFVLFGIDLRASAIALVPVALISGSTWRWLAPHVGRLKPAVASYVVVISLMVIAAAGGFGRGPGGPWLLIAALAFYFSDLFVARNRFVAPGPVNRMIGLPLYYGAQLLFGWAAALGS